MTKTFYHTAPFLMENGYILPNLHLAYTTYGILNSEKNNVVWVFHAFTANSDARLWWPGMIGEGKCIDTNIYYVICVNMPGSCYGSIDALSTDPTTGRPYYHNFPWFSTRDMIRAFQLLKKSLGIQQVKLGIGGSMGGQQLLEWAIEEPELFQYIVMLATNAKHSPWGIAFNATQRMAIETDPTWKEDSPTAGIEGMKTARAIALLSYRTQYIYEKTQQGLSLDNDSPFNGLFKAESYQRYQGEKLAKRFNAFSYYFLTKGMDCHDVGRGRGGIERALGRITAKSIVVRISGDILFTSRDERFLAENISGCSYYELTSMYGHDGFLIEYGKISAIISPILTN